LCRYVGVVVWLFALLLLVVDYVVALLFVARLRWFTFPHTLPRCSARYLVVTLRLLLRSPLPVVTLLCCCYVTLLRCTFVVVSLIGRYVVVDLFSLRRCLRTALPVTLLRCYLLVARCLLRCCLTLRWLLRYTPLVVVDFVV